MDILFITSTRIGDAILTTGLLDHLVRTRPEARFTIVCGPLPAPLFEAVPRLARVIPLTKQSWSRHWWRLWRDCVRTRWHTIVNLRNSPTVYLMRAGERFSFRHSHDPVHRVRQLGALLGLDPPPAPRLWLRPEDEAEAERLIPPGPPVLALGPTASWPGKEWPAERYAELVARLTAAGGILPGARIALFAAASERERALPAIAGVPAERVIDLAGRTGLRLAAACLGRADLFVGNDSGLMHLAAAAGTPTLGLFGPSRDELYAPWGPASAAVRTDESMAELERLAAAEAWPRSRSWMSGLPVDRVEAAATALWDRGAGLSGSRRRAAGP